MKPIGQLDTTHEVFQPTRRAKKCKPPTAAPKPAPYLKNQEDREKWMREKQRANQAKKRAMSPYVRKQIAAALLVRSPSIPQDTTAIREENQKLAAVEQAREAQLLAEAEAEIRQRRISEGLAGTVNKEAPDFKKV